MPCRAMTNTKVSPTFHKERKPAQEAVLTQLWFFQIQTLKSSVPDLLCAFGQPWESSWAFGFLRQNSTSALPRPFERLLSCLYTVYRRGPGAPPGRGQVSSPLGPRRPTEAAELSGTLPNGQLRRGNRCGDLAWDAPPLPRNSPTRQGQGRPSSRCRPRRSLDTQARGRAPGRRGRHGRGHPAR